MNETVPVAYVLAFIVIALIVGVYLWSRKSAKHPEYAAGLELKADAVAESVAAWLAFKGFESAAADVRRVKDVNLVKFGQDVYETIEPRLNSLEMKINELLARTPK